MRKEYYFDKYWKIPTNLLNITYGAKNTDDDMKNSLMTLQHLEIPHLWYTCNSTAYG